MVPFCRMDSVTRARFLGALLRRAGAIFGAFALASSALGCTTHQCDPTTVDIGGDEEPPAPWVRAEGELIWQSPSSVFGPWLPFPGAFTYAFALPPIPTLEPGESADVDLIDVTAEVADVQGAADAAPVNFTQITGELAQIVNLTPSSFSVVNPTCAQYFLRVSVKVPIVSAAEGDGGADATDASVSALE
jgi:hypothetical protein